MISVALAHPCPESFVAAVFRRVAAVLETGGDVTRLDLYVDGYCPGRPLPPAHSHALEKSTALVLVYPTWWSSQPAILTAWLVAATEQDLRHVTRLVCVTTHGGGRLPNFVIGQAGRVTVARAFKARCAPNASFQWIACYGLDSCDDARREAFLGRVDAELRPRRDSPNHSTIQA